MKRYTIPILSALCVIAVAVMIFALASGGGAGAFTPPPFDAAAQAGAPEPPQTAGYSEIDAEAFRFSVAGALTAQDGKTDVWLTNPADSTVWLKVRILDENGNTLGESGLLRPGEYVQSVALAEQPKATAPVQMKIMAYEPETYYSAGAATLRTQLGVS